MAHGTYSENWRARVRAHHARQATLRSIAVGDELRLAERCTHARVKVLTVKPRLTARVVLDDGSLGMAYTIPRSVITSVTKTA